MPPSCFAFFIVTNGEVQNPEFVVWREDDFTEEMWQWKKKNIRLTGDVEYWCKKGREYYRFNPFAT